jgi:hypothetical protein
MAATYPTGSSTDTSTMTTVVGVLALIAIIALVYFISRGARSPVPGTTPERPSTEQSQREGSSPESVPAPNR